VPHRKSQHTVQVHQLGSVSTTTFDAYFPTTHSMFHFATSSCTPSQAEQNGKQTDGNTQDNCLNMSKGCAPLQPWNGFNTQSWPFPTYYTVHKCGDGTWRVTYSLYFRHVSYVRSALGSSQSFSQSRLIPGRGPLKRLGVGNGHLEEGRRIVVPRRHDL
jgi:hypothetical protein